MFVRLAMPEDEDGVIRLARLYAEEVGSLLPHVAFDETHTRETFRHSITKAHPTTFVAIQGDDVIGMLICSIQGFYFMAGHWANNDIFYVQPEKRGSRAATLLIAAFNTWADEIGAQIAVSGNANKLSPDRTEKFHSHFGYEQVGRVLMRFRGV